MQARRRTLALASAGALLTTGALATPAAAEIGTVDIRVTVSWDDGDPATTDEPLVLEATDVTPSDEGPEIGPEDIVSNPDELCAFVGVDFQPTVDGVMVGGFGGSTECRASTIEVEITSGEIEQWLSLADYLGFVDEDGFPGDGADLATELTDDGVTLTWTPADDAVDFVPAGISFFGYVTEAPFPDVTTANEFAWHIQFLNATEIATGYEDGTYRPTAPISRQAMAAFLFRLEGDAEYEAPEESPFADVPTDHPFYTEIAWLAENGITTGYAVGDEVHFRPTAPVSRQAMAAFLHRLLPDEPPVTAEQVAETFVDVGPGNEFYADILWLAEAGISTGTVTPEGTYFRPAEPVSRQAMAAFIVRLQLLTPFFLAAEAGDTSFSLESAVR